VTSAARFLDTLRGRTLSDEPETRSLLPANMSAEDLGSATWHHYWDDLWAIAGYREAAFAAAENGQPAPNLNADPAHLEIVRKAMAAVVNGSGTAVASKLPLEGIQMAGKTGTAQVFRLGERGHQSNWALRDHALFIAFAPADKPRFAIGCIIEHGGFGASAAAPIVRDSMTFLFDQQKALDALAPLEKQWGGTLAERNARQAAKFEAIARASAKATPTPKPPAEPAT